jgi:archaellum biogenesis protein FlaJ (TadC family)
MKASQFIRQCHRWISIAFMIAVIVNIAALAMQRQEVWIGLIALAPLILLMASGLYLFVLPYVARARRAD